MINNYVVISLSAVLVANSHAAAGAGLAGSQRTPFGSSFLQDTPQAEVPFVAQQTEWLKSGG